MYMHVVNAIMMNLTHLGGSILQMEKIKNRKGVLRPLLKKYSGAYLLGLITLLVVDYVDLFVPKLIGEATDGLTAHALNAHGILVIAGKIVLCGAVVMFGRFWWRHAYRAAVAAR